MLNTIDQGASHVVAGTGKVAVVDVVYPDFADLTGRIVAVLYVAIKGEIDTGQLVVCIVAVTDSVIVIGVR